MSLHVRQVAQEVILFVMKALRLPAALGIHLSMACTALQATAAGLSSHVVTLAYVRVSKASC